MKAGKIFSASVWSALALAMAGATIADTASAQDREGRGRSERQANERRGGGDWGSQRVQRQAQTAQARPSRDYNADAVRSRQAQPDRQPARSWSQGRAQVAQEAQRQPQRDGRSWNRGDSGDRNGSWNRGDNRSDWNRDRADNARRNDYAQRDNNNRSDWRGDRNDHRSAGRDNYRNWDRNSWRRDDRYDWRSYRDRNRSTYRIGRYYAPYRGYSYRRLSIGFSLGSMFYGNRYWINDPWSYRLPQVYGPYRWVRYYDDVLLVNIYSGEVVDVIYDFFW